MLGPEREDFELHVVELLRARRRWSASRPPTGLRAASRGAAAGEHRARDRRRAGGRRSGDGAVGDLTAVREAAEKGVVADAPPPNRAATYPAAATAIASDRANGAPQPAETLDGSSPPSPRRTPAITAPSALASGVSRVLSQGKGTGSAMAERAHVLAERGRHAVRRGPRFDARRPGFGQGMDRTRVRAIAVAGVLALVVAVVVLLPGGSSTPSDETASSAAGGSPAADGGGATPAEPAVATPTKAERDAAKAEREAEARRWLPRARSARHGPAGRRAGAEPQRQIGAAGPRPPSGAVAPRPRRRRRALRPRRRRSRSVRRRRRRLRLRLCQAGAPEALADAFRRASGRGFHGGRGDVIRARATRYFGAPGVLVFGTRVTGCSGDHGEKRLAARSEEHGGGASRVGETGHRIHQRRRRGIRCEHGQSQRRGDLERHGSPWRSWVWR